MKRKSENPKKGKQIDRRGSFTKEKYWKDANSMINGIGKCSNLRKKIAKDFRCAEKGI